MIRLSAFALAVLLAVATLPAPGHADGPAVGSRAPLFEASSTAGTIRLADIPGRGRVVLAFYYRDFTPV